MSSDEKRRPMRGLHRLRSAGPGSVETSSPATPLRSPAPPRTLGRNLGEGQTTPNVDLLEQPKEERVDRLRKMIERIVAKEGSGTRKRKKRRAPRSDELPGAIHDTAQGSLRIVEAWVPPGQCHGRIPADAFLSVRPETFAKLALDPALQHIDPRNVLFIDTETTGLSHGGGTVPFLIGIAYFEDGSLHLEQLFLDQLGNEAPMLRRLSKAIERSTCIVSYNGKSFDWPLLRSRYVINRVPAPAIPAHFDLLHCSRRLFKGTLPRVRLIDMEDELLGLRREDDTPGSEIPALYIDYLRGGDPSPMVGVLEHNASDLIALAAIGGELGRRFETLKKSDEPALHLAYAKVAERAKSDDRALEFARAAASGGGDAACTTAAHLISARIARRRGDLQSEEASLKNALLCSDDHIVRTLLSQYYEHRKKSLVSALQHALHSGEQKRITRLAKRLGRKNIRKRLSVRWRVE